MNYSPRRLLSAKCFCGHFLLRLFTYIVLTNTHMEQRKFHPYRSSISKIAVRWDESAKRDETLYHT